MTTGEKTKEAEADLKPYCVGAKVSYKTCIYLHAHSKDDAKLRAYGVLNGGGPDSIFGDENCYVGGDAELVEEECSYQIDFVDRSDYPIIETVEEVEE